MTSLLYTGKEKKLITDFIAEAFKLYGICCTLYDISSMSMYLDDRVLQSGISYKILLQEYIDTRLLSNLRWSTIDANRESITALAPISYGGKDFNLREFNVIKLCNGDTYQIREVNSTYLIGTLYVLKLITYRDEKNRPRAEKQMKTNYFITDREEIE